eukprot:1161405-Pelagomonas_calceolata.AAC.3
MAVKKAGNHKPLLLGCIPSFKRLAQETMVGFSQTSVDQLTKNDSKRIWQGTRIQAWKGA